MQYYLTCPLCGANLDLNEKCDCNENKEDKINEINIKKVTYSELQGMQR